RFSPFDTEFTGEMAFRRDDGPLIELHWQLTPAEWLRRLIALDSGALWQDAQPLELDGVRALQLSPPDTLLHLCLHLAAHCYVHPAGYQDIVRLLNHYQPFPWSTFVSRVTCFRLRAACYFALEAAASVLGASVPQEVLVALRPPAWQRRLVRRIADPRRALAGELPCRRPRSYLLHLSVADRPADVVAVMLWLLFPGRHWLAERYRLQGRLRPWLACLWHPFVILWQGFLGLRELVRT
ncbi:MAG: nucleotidyltransferase family protein, partial [Anaerolineae bacterium]|nr:nucleotidyltransferase family protein [Anaerolineae bacterium]